MNGCVYGGFPAFLADELPNPAGKSMYKIAKRVYNGIEVTSILGGP
jgi:hypothetical protein